jgi:hypothetical protein
MFVTKNWVITIDACGQALSTCRSFTYSSVHTLALCTLTRTNCCFVSLSMGLPVGPTKHLCARTRIVCRRICKGDDLEDGLLMPNLS